MYNIRDNERLCRVRKYELHREHGRLLIDVFEVIGGCCGGFKYIAVPTLPQGVEAKERVGLGYSEDEAINECLSRTQGLISDTLFQDLCRDDFPVKEVLEPAGDPY